MRIPLFYRGEYSLWHERFMNYLEEQTYGEAMINSIQNGDQPLPVIAQVSLVGTAQNEPPTLKDPKFWTVEEKKTQKNDLLERSLLIQGLPNDIYSLIDSNKTAKDLWDALERQMRGSKYVINDLKKYGYKKDNCKLNYKFLNNLQQEWKQYATLMRKNKNVMDIIFDALYNILKQNQGDVNDALGYKKKVVVINVDPLALKITALLAKAFNRRKIYTKPTKNNLRTSSTSQSANKKQEFVKSDDKKVEKKADEKKRDLSKVKCYNYKKEGHFAKDCKKAKEINANMVFMAQIKNVLLESNKSSSSIKEIIAKNKKTAHLLAQTKVLKEQLQVKHVVIDTHVECHEKYAKLEAKRYEYMIRYFALFDNDKQHRKQIVDQEVLFDKMSIELVELDKHVRDLKNSILEKDFKISELEEYVCNKDLEIEKCLERLNVYENKLHKMGQTNQTIHMIMPSKDKLYNGRKGFGFKNLSYFKRAKDLRPTLYDEKVIGLGYTPMFLTHSNEDLKIEKFKRSRENKTEFAYDYRNLNASYVNEKINFEDYYFHEMINPGFEKIDSPFQQTSSLKPYVPNVILKKIIIDLEDEVVNLLEKEKVNLETIESLKSKGFESSEKAISESKNQSENDCHLVEKQCDNIENLKVIAPGMFKLNLDTFSSVRRPKHIGVIWKKKGPSNTSKVDLSAVGHSKLNKNVKRYFRKDLLSCNNSHLGETSSAYVCNDAMNVSCNHRMCDLLDGNNFFIFDDDSVRISPVSKMPLRKKPSDSMNVRSKSNMIKSLTRTIVQICLWIIDLGCSKRMTGNRALLTNFVEKFLRTVRFGNNDFAVIAGYGDVVIGSMTIKKVYYDVGKLKAKEDIGMFIEYSKESTAFRIYNKRTRIDYDVMFAPVAQIKAIRLFLAYAAHKDFTVFQIDVKTAFLNGILKEEVYVGQPPVPTPMVEQSKLKLDLVGKPVDHTDYRSMIGSLMYVTSNRPDIMFTTCMCARYQANPNEHHVSAVKRIFHYLKGTINLGLWYPNDSDFDLTAYSNADHAGCHLDRKISSYCAQVLWMRTQLTDYGFFYDKVPIYCDSKSAIAISCNPIQYTHTKHIDVRYHFIKDHVAKGTIELYFVGIEYQLADLFMKSLSEARFKLLVEKLGMMSRET
nr:hypothetical protein [Tanacetum cinerariifolium]